MSADAEFHGAQLKQGEKIILLFESANFDETAFGDPDNFRIDRYPTITWHSASVPTSA